MLTSKKTKTPRSFRILGPQRQIDERETPHPKVDRGEFGPRLLDWRKNRAGSDPFRRLFGGGGEGDPNNTLQKISGTRPREGQSQRIPATIRLRWRANKGVAKSSRRCRGDLSLESLCLANRVAATRRWEKSRRPAPAAR